MSTRICYIQGGSIVSSWNGQVPSLCMRMRCMSHLHMATLMHTTPMHPKTTPVVLYYVIGFSGTQLRV